MPLLALDQVDLGLVSVYLGSEAVNITDCGPLALSANAQHLVIGREDRALLLPQCGAAGQPRLLPPANVGDAVRCMCWLPGPAAEVLLIGYSSGSLRAFSTSGELLWSAVILKSPLIQMHPGGLEAALFCLFEDGAIAAAPSLQGLLRHPSGAVVANGAAAAAASGSSWPDAGHAPFWLYELPRDCADAYALVCCGPRPELPLDLTIPSLATAADGRQRKIVLMAARPLELQLHLLDPPVLSAPESLQDLLSGRNSKLLLRRGLGALATALLGTGAGDAEGASSSDATGHIEAEDGETLRPQPQPPKASVSVRRALSSTAAAISTPPLAARVGETDHLRSFSDASRGFGSLILEPRRRRWLAATDTFGRVLLLEPKTLVCARLFKGYRDAQCAWTNAAAAACEGSSSLGPETPLLVIYAPRRGLLEIWRVPAGGRVLACNVGTECMLLSSSTACRQPVVRSAAERRPSDRGDAAGQEEAGGADCFLLQLRTGVLFAVRKAPPS